MTTDRAYGGPKEALLTIEIKNKSPVELADFTQSLLSLSEEFRRHIEAQEPEIFAADVRLYVKEVRPGSIIADIVALSPQALQLISYSAAVVNFYKFVKASYDYLSGASVVLRSVWNLTDCLRE